MSAPVKKTKRKPTGAAAMGAGPGRPKGSVNKVTKNAREAIARFVDANTDRLSGWLDEIYEQDGPKAAFQCFSDVLEYHVPKLARIAHTGDEDSPIPIVFSWKKSEK